MEPFTGNFCKKVKNVQRVKNNFGSVIKMADSCLTGDTFGYYFSNIVVDLAYPLGRAIKKYQIGPR